jgi:hypothetical protein
MARAQPSYSAANGILLVKRIQRFVADAEGVYSYESRRGMNTLIVGKSIMGLNSHMTPSVGAKTLQVK